MGDRRMVEVKSSEGSLFVYSHWGGFELPKRAVAAIKSAQPRWNDEPYGVRIIVDQLIAPGRDQETGYGLMLKPSCEDSYNGDKPSILIDLVEQRLTIQGESNGVVGGTFQEVVTKI